MMVINSGVVVEHDDMLLPETKARRRLHGLLALPAELSAKVFRGRVFVPEILASAGAVENRVPQSDHRIPPFRLSNSAVERVPKTIRERTDEKPSKEPRIQWPVEKRVLMDPGKRLVRVVDRIEDEERIVPI